MSDAKVISVRFEYPNTPFEGKAKAVLEMDDGTAGELDFYHDEISFSEPELVGRTLAECRDLYRKKDVEWLRS